MAKKGKKGFSAVEPIKSRKQFRRMLKRRTQGLVQPQLQELQREAQRERGATKGRQQDIGQWYGSYSQRLQEAFNRTNEALNRIISESSAGGAQAQQGLAAALQASSAEDRELAERLGTTALPNAADEGALQTFASAEALRGAQGQGVGALLAGTGARQEIAGLSELRSREDETQRVRALINDINRRKADIVAQRPALREQIRKQIIDEELAKSGQKFQERIAGQELKLSKKQQKLAERQQAHQEQLDFANLALQEKQLKAQIKQAIASGKIDKAGGDKAITKFQVAREQMEKFVDAQLGKGKKKGKITDRDAFNLFQKLTQNYKVPRKMVLKLFTGSGVRGLRKWAKKKQNPATSISDIFKDVFGGAPWLNG